MPTKEKETRTEDKGAVVFAIVPVEACIDPRLTKMQLRMLIALLSFRNKNTDTIWPKRETLAKRCGYSINTVSKITGQLVDLGWLIKTGSGGRSSSSSYKVTVPDLDTVLHDETVAEVETVSNSETVSEPGNKTLAEPATKPSPEWIGAKNIPRTDKGTDSNNTTGTDHPVFSGQQSSLVVVSAQWQPSEALFGHTKFRGIPDSFVHACLPDFTLQWSGHKQRQGQLDSKFLKHVIREWELAKTAAHSSPTLLPGDWEPDGETVRALRTEGVSDEFIWTTAAAFRMYWTERREPRHSWGSMFFTHCVRGWSQQLGLSRGKGVERPADTLERFTDRSWAEDGAYEHNG